MWHTLNIIEKALKNTVGENTRLPLSESFYYYFDRCALGDKFHNPRVWRNSSPGEEKLKSIFWGQEWKAFLWSSSHATCSILSCLLPSDMGIFKSFENSIWAFSTYSYYIDNVDEEEVSLPAWMGSLYLLPSPFLLERKTDLSSGYCWEGISHILFFCSIRAADRQLGRP